VDCSGTRWPRVSSLSTLARIPWENPESAQVCDQFIADNQQNYELAVKLGWIREISPLGVVQDRRYWYRLSLTDLERVAITAWAHHPMAESLRMDKFKSTAGSWIFQLAWIILNPVGFTCYGVFSLRLRCGWNASWRNSEQLPSFWENRSWAHSGIDVAARIMLAPSLSDGIPNTMLEAMAAGLFQ